MTRIISTRAWLPWALLALVLAGLYLAAPYAVRHWVYEPSVKPGAWGMRAEVFGAVWPGGEVVEHRHLPDTERVELDRQHASLLAYGLWRVREGGTYRLELSCDDAGAVWVDGAEVIRLLGTTNLNQGGVELNLAAGDHLLTLELNNGPGAGWLSLKVAGPGDGQPRPLAGEDLPLVELGNLGDWWGVVSITRHPVFLLLALLALSTLAGAILGRPGLSPLAAPLGRVMATKAGMAAALALVALCAYFLVMGGRLYSLDDAFRFRITQALATEGTVQIGHHHERKHNFSKYGVLHPLLMTPLYAVGRLSAGAWPPGNDPPQVMVSLGMQLITAASVLAFFLLLRELGYGRRAAAVAALLYALASIALPYAKDHFTEPLNGLLMLLALWLAARAQMRASRRALWGMAAMLALIGVNAPSMLLAVGAPLGVYTAWLIWPRTDGPCRRWSQTLVWGLGALVPVLLAVGWTFLFNYLRYLDPMDFGYRGEHPFPNLIYDGRPGWTLAWWVGLEGLLFSPGKSIFLYSPLVIAGLWGLGRFLKRNRAQGWLIIGWGLAFLAFYTKWWAWHGDVSWGPRYLVPVAGLFLLPLAALLSDWRDLHWGQKTFFAALVLLGLAVQLEAILLPFDAYFHEVVAKDYSNQFFLHYIPHFSPLKGHLDLILSGRRFDLYLWPSPVLKWLLLLTALAAAAVIQGLAPAGVLPRGWLRRARGAQA